MGTTRTVAMSRSITLVLYQATTTPTARLTTFTMTAMTLRLTAIALIVSDHQFHHRIGSAVARRLLRRVRNVVARRLLRRVSNAPARRLLRRVSSAHRSPL